MKQKFKSESEPKDNGKHFWELNKHRLFLLFLSVVFIVFAFPKMSQALAETPVISDFSGEFTGASPKGKLLSGILKINFIASVPLEAAKLKLKLTGEKNAVYQFKVTDRNLPPGKFSAELPITVLKGGVYVMTLESNGVVLGQTRQNIKLRNFDAVLYYPRYRNTIFEGMNLKKVQIEIFVNDPASPRNGRIQLLHKSGAFADMAYDFTVDGNHLLFELPLPESLECGEYMIDVVLGESEQQILLFKVAGTTKHAEVFFDQNDNLVFNGKKIFPMGFYYQVPAVDEYVRSGFNLVIDLRPDFQQYDQSGILTFINVRQPYDDTFQVKPPREEVSPEGMAEAVRRFQLDLPWNAGFYAVDEPEYHVKNKSLYRKMLQQMLEKSPRMPLLVTHNTIPGLAFDADLAHIINMDPYLGFERGKKDPLIGYKLVADTVSAAVKAVKHRKPVWVTLQCLANFHYGKTPRKSRFPTINETRLMSYLAIIHGARGLTFYREVPLAARNLWPAMKAFAREIKMMEPFLLAADKFPPTVTGSVHWLRRDAGGKSCFIVVNTGAQKTQVSLPTRFEDKLYELSGDRKLESKDGLAVLDLEPYAVHLFWTVPPPSSPLTEILKNYREEDSYVGIESPGNSASFWRNAEPFASGTNPWRKLWNGNDENPVEEWAAPDNAVDAFFGVHFAAPSEVSRIFVTAKVAPAKIEVLGNGDDTWRPVEIQEKAMRYKYWNDMDNRWLVVNEKPQTANIVYTVWEYKIKPIKTEKIRLFLNQLSELKTFQ